MRPGRGDVCHSHAACSWLAALLPDLEPEPFRDGLVATLEWFRTVEVSDSEVGAGPSEN